jgi:hypothetical protein
MTDNTEYAVKLDTIEEKILMELRDANGPRMLEDDRLVSTLSDAKETAIEIEQRMGEAEITQRRINNVRLNY